MTASSRDRLIAIGDIHGCIHALQAVLSAIEPAPSDRIVVLGDFVDGGRDSAAVIERLMALQSQCRLIVLMGNHEEMMLESLHNERLRSAWLDMGGIDTVFSYRFGGTIDDIPRRHIEFIERSLSYYETEHHLFTHANYDPELPLAAQPPEMLRWTPLDPDEQQPHVSGKTAIVGHWAQRGGEILDLPFVKCIDTDCRGAGWLTALDVSSGRVWQASRWGVLRETESNDGLKRACELMGRPVA